MTGYRSRAARDLVAAVQAAGGTVERTGTGRIRITGPTGTISIHEPSGETRRDLRRSSAWKLIKNACGLDLTEG